MWNEAHLMGFIERNSKITNREDSNMEDKKLVLKCVKVGIFGGLFLAVAPTVLFISLMGLSLPLLMVTAFLVLYTVVMILITAYESKKHFKGDPRVHKWATDLFYWSVF